MVKSLRRKKKLEALKYLENMKNFKIFFDQILWHPQQGEDQDHLKERILDLEEGDHLILEMNEVLDQEDLMKLDDQEAVDLEQDMIDQVVEMILVDLLQDMTDLDMDKTDLELDMIDHHLALIDLDRDMTDLLQVMIEVMIDLL